MSASQPTHSPLARLVLFMVCLAIAGSALAGAHYFAVDLPQQNSQAPPENSPSRCQVVVGLPMVYALINSGEWNCDEMYTDSGHRTFECCLRNFV